MLLFFAFPSKKTISSLDSQQTSCLLQYRNILCLEKHETNYGSLTMPVDMIDATENLQCPLNNSFTDFAARQNEMSCALKISVSVRKISHD